MTKQETFKRRVRARMATTGERYAAARRALLAAADGRADNRSGGRSDDGGKPARVWVSLPETSEESVIAATGRGWNEWCDVIEAGLDPVPDHAAIAAHLERIDDIGGWWAQTITVGYERIIGRRQPNQQNDGTFTVNRSRTVPVDDEALRRALLDDEERAGLFGGEEVTLRSRPSAKAIRLGLDHGVAVVSITPRDGGRATVAVQHRGLPSLEELERRRFWWREWLDALAGDG